VRRFAGMNLARYPFEYFSEKYYYQFYSTGPNGKVRKLVCFQLSRNGPIQTFNLALGDVEEDSDEINDKVVTNNNDSLKVLFTVALVALEFLRYRPGVWISAEGNTPARNRLYQMWIVKYWNEINKHFTVLGKIDDCHYPFERGINYEGFMFICKK
jgi:hypothetical protein